MEENEPMRIVLLGKTGAGKSSLANVIYGEKGKFKKSAAAKSETKECHGETKMINGRLIRLIDTPGLFDTELNNTELSSDILKCIEDCAPGPHAFLVVLKVERFTSQEQQVVDKILKHFSDEALQYTTVVFTHGDQLEGQKIENWVQDNVGLRSLVRKCGGRCHVFDNKYWDNQNEVTQLLNTLHQTVMDKNGKHYTNKYLEFVINNMKRIRLNVQFAAEVLLGALLGVKEFANDLVEKYANVLVENRPSMEEDTSSFQGATGVTLRIVLLGKIGAGKSSVINTILGEHVFKVNHSSHKPQSIVRSAHGRNIQLIEIPALFNGWEFVDPDLGQKVLKAMKDCAPGPHAFLLVLRVERFTAQEQHVVDYILKYFSEEALKYTTVVFTHGDNLDDGQKIEDWYHQIEALRSLVQKCGGRCHVFDNKYWNNSEDTYRNNTYQTTQLLQTIDRTVEKNEGGFYDNKRLENPTSFFRRMSDWFFK
ncbi:unnamed protein product [Knipowitschia caucasica]